MHTLLSQSIIFLDAGVSFREVGGVVVVDVKVGGMDVSDEVVFNILT